MKYVEMHEGIEINNYNEVKKFLSGELYNSDLYDNAEKITKEALKESKDEELSIQYVFNLLIIELKRKEFITAKTKKIHKDLVKKVLKVRNKYAGDFYENRKDKSYIKRNQFQLIAFETLINNYLSVIEGYYYSKGGNDLALELLVIRFRVKRTVYKILRPTKFKYKGLYYWYTFLKFTSDYGTSFTQVSRTTFTSIIGFSILYFLIDFIIIGSTGEHLVNSISPISYLLYSMGVMSNLGTMATPVNTLHELLVFTQGLYGLVILGIFLNLFHQQMK